MEELRLTAINGSYAEGYNQLGGHYQERFERLLMQYFPEGRGNEWIITLNEKVFIYAWRIWHDFFTTEGKAFYMPKYEAALGEIAFAVLSKYEDFPKYKESFWTAMDVFNTVHQWIGVFRSNNANGRKATSLQFQQGALAVDHLIDIAIWYVYNFRNRLLADDEHDSKW